MRAVQEEPVLRMIGVLPVTEHQIRLSYVRNFERFLGQVHQSSSSTLNVASVETSCSSASSGIESGEAVVTGTVTSMGPASSFTFEESPRANSMCWDWMEISSRKAMSRPCQALLRQPLQ